VAFCDFIIEGNMSNIIMNGMLRIEFCLVLRCAFTF
jgi:predicted cation transporter